VPDFALEDVACADGYIVIAGVDEAGRGPWAGPVVAGAAVLERGAMPEALLAQLDDSKKLKTALRASLFAQMQNTPGVHFGIGIASVEEIDRHNILEATMMAMTRAVAALPVIPDMALVDGNRQPRMPCAVRTVVKGDALSLSIATASIAAKETRDRIMTDLARSHPGYGWETNAGYGTARHQAALGKLGVTPHHRRSFRPIRALRGG
jgi:ribonuclease HII